MDSFTGWFLLCVVAATYFLLLASSLAQDWIRFLDIREKEEGKGPLLTVTTLCQAGQDKPDQAGEHQRPPKIDQGGVPTHGTLP